jgi:hypothetical protein
MWNLTKYKLLFLFIVAINSSSLNQCMYALHKHLQSKKNINEYLDLLKEKQ